MKQEQKACGRRGSGGCAPVENENSYRELELAGLEACVALLKEEVRGLTSKTRVLH